jgi:hypothetical protein
VALEAGEILEDVLNRGRKILPGFGGTITSGIVGLRIWVTITVAGHAQAERSHRRARSSAGLESAVKLPMNE